MVRIALLALFLAAPAAAAPVFGVRTDLPAPTNPLAVAIADINQDSHLDLVVLSSGGLEGQLTTWFGRGDGYFYAGPSTSTVRSPGRLAVGDLDADGIPDLAITAGTHLEGPNNTMVQVLLGAGDGSFVSGGTLLASDDGQDLSGIAIGDLDEDGKADIACSIHNSITLGEPGVATIFHGFANGTFALAADLGTSHGGVTDVALGDIDGDGDNDIALASEVAGHSLVLRQGGNQWMPEVGPVGDARIALGQLDGDGILDRVYTMAGTAKLVVGRSGASAVPYQVAISAPAMALVARDVDGDGHADITFARDLPGQVEFLKGHGDGTFDAASAYAVGTRPRSLAAADLNGDGLVDLAVANNGSASVTVLLQGHPVIGTSPGPETFALSRAFPNPTRGAINFAFESPGSEPYVLAVHDLRGRLVASRAGSASERSIRMFENERPAAGIYWATLTQGARVASKRFVVLP